MVSFIKDYANKALTAINPLAPLPQMETAKNLSKIIEQKRRLIVSMQSKIKEVVLTDPQQAEQLNQYVESLAKRRVELKERQRLEKVDGICARLGKMSSVSNYLFPGTGNVLIALSIAGKSANVICHAFSSGKNGECLTEKATNLVWDYAYNGTWRVATYLFNRV